MLMPLIWPSSAQVIPSKDDDVAGLLVPWMVAAEAAAGSVSDSIKIGDEEEADRASCTSALISMGSEQQYQQMDDMSPPYVLNTPEQ